MPIMPPSANYHHNAHPQAKTVQINLIWNEPAQWLLNSCVCKIPEARITPNGTPLYPHGQMTMTLNIYMPSHSNGHDVWGESAQWFLSYGIFEIPGTLITPMGMLIMPPWSNDHDVTHLQAKTILMNLIWSESAQWLLSSHVYKIARTLIIPMWTSIMPPWANDHNIAHLHANTVPMDLIWSESAQ